MHEYGMCDGIVDAIQRRAAGRRVARVKVRVGVMHRIVEEAFSTPSPMPPRARRQNRAGCRHCRCSSQSRLPVVRRDIRQRGARDRVRELQRRRPRSSGRRRAYLWSPLRYDATSSDRAQE